MGNILFFDREISLNFSITDPLDAITFPYLTTENLLFLFPTILYG